MKHKKERTPEERKAEYLKRIKSPSYVKNVKRNMQMFEMYNLMLCVKRALKTEMRARRITTLL